MTYTPEKEKIETIVTGKEIETIVTGKLGNGAEEGCNTCPNEYPLEFRDIPSYREYKVTGICQKCQDEVFGKESK